MLCVFYHDFKKKVIGVLPRQGLHGRQETMAGPRLGSSQSVGEAERQVAGDNGGACTVAKGRTGDGELGEETTCLGSRERGVIGSRGLR